MIASQLKDMPTLFGNDLSNESALVLYPHNLSIEMHRNPVGVEQILAFSHAWRHP
jgi:hypothetical protein